MDECIANLDHQFDIRGARLAVLSGDPVELFAILGNNLPFNAIFYQNLMEPDEIVLEARISSWAAANGVRMIPSDGLTVHPVSEVIKQTGSPYTVFSPYYRAWSGLFIRQPLPPPQNIPLPANLSNLMDNFFHSAINASSKETGETAALNSLDKFIKSGLESYPAHRDPPCLNGTSRLSAYLNLGAVSPREVAWRCLREKKRTQRDVISPAEVFLRQIAWRDFYCSILFHFPHVLSRNFKSKYDGIPWENNPALYKAWQNGETGYPIVDAGMRQLMQEGWMHNRVRMITASFLTKSLLSDWRLGEMHFMNLLTDGDIACNNGGWQWAASTGTDAQPWFRIFNPTLQGEKFDAEGAYVKRYLPELSKLPATIIHKPWTLTSDEQIKYGVILGKTYPHPIVDHSVQRARYLGMMRAYN